MESKAKVSEWMKVLKSREEFLKYREDEKQRSIKDSEAKKE